MKIHLCRYLCLVALLLARSIPVQAQEAFPLQGPPPAAPTQTATLIFEAQIIDATGPLVHAEGNARFVDGNEKLTASEVDYNTDTLTGSLENATFTTCTKTKPDYIIEARKVRILPNHRITAYRVSLVLGNVKVITLPVLSFRAGGRAGTAQVFPRPEYDQVDGVSIEQKLRLIDNDRDRTIADLRLTQKHGIQGEFTSRYGIDGIIGDLPGRSAILDTLDQRNTNLPISDKDVTADISELARLSAYGTINLRSRTYDIRNIGLVLYRRPELGATYTANAINFTKTKLDPRLQIYPQLDTSWGLYKEVPSQEENYISRRSGDAAIAANFIPLGPKTAVQPIFYHNWSWYGTGQSYQNWFYAIDAAHVFNNGSIIGARYIKREELGVTPFQFDSVEILKELQSSVQFRRKHSIAALALDWDLGAGTLYEWEVCYGYTTDCLGGWLRWDNRLQRLSFNVALIHL